MHKLADSLNGLGHEAYIYPSFENIIVNKTNPVIPTLKLVRDFYRHLRPFKTNVNFVSPIYSGSIKALDSDDWIIVYYEQVSGNPLNAKNIVRWLLHQPGFHTGIINYGFNEYHVKFNNAIRDFHYPNSKLASSILPLIHYPLEFYNLDNLSEKRNDTAYCIRKGRGKKIVHDLSNSILIDNLSHEQISKIFKRVATFISYDSYTAYSRFAALCGCDSIVIPDEDVSEAEWYPNHEDRLGVAYGFNNIEAARETRPLLRKKILEEINQSNKSVQTFAVEANNFFDEPRYNLFRNYAR